MSSSNKDAVRNAAASGALAGIAAAVVFAVCDCSALVIGSGGFWLRSGPAAAAILIYVATGAGLGAGAGAVWFCLRGPARDERARFHGMVLLFTFGSLVVFFSTYLYDLGFGHERQGTPLHYALCVPLSLILAVVASVLLRLPLYLFRSAKRQRLWAIVVFASTACAGILLVRFSNPGTSRSTDSTAAPEIPNVVLLVLDTTRFDALSCYGNMRPTTPCLDGVAGEGVTFTRAYAPASWTAPSHASIFTGNYPSRHGTFSNQVLLLPGTPTMAEVMSHAGYESCFLSYKAILRSAFGYTRGFDHAVTVNVENKSSLFTERVYEKFVRNIESLTPKTIDMALAWLGARETTRPFFLFVNVNDPHTKYVPREPFFSACLDGLDLDAVDVAKVRHLARNQHTLAMYNRGEIPLLNEAELEYLRCLYDSEAHYMDGLLCGFFEGLQALDYERRTVVIITSDHGEMLGEHQLMSHGAYLYDELLRVPLIVWGLGAAGTRTDPVSLVDLFPTLLELAGISAPAGIELDGTSLLSPSRARTLYAESLANGVVRKALIELERKYIWESTGQTYLFDTAKDPFEQNNVVADEPGVVATMHGKLESALESALEGVRPEELDQDVLKVLKSLGYLQ